MIKNIKYLKKYIIIYSLFFLTVTFLLFVLINFELFIMDALFFGFIKNLLISIFGSSIILIFITAKQKLLNFICWKDFVILNITCFLIHYSIYGLIPFTTSRSASLIMMGHFLNNNTNSYTIDEIKAYVNQEYFENTKAVQKRLEEQVKLGNLKKLNKKYKITKKGVTIIKSMGYITKLYKTDKNYALINKNN